MSHVCLSVCLSVCQPEKVSNLNNSGLFWYFWIVYWEALKTIWKTSKKKLEKLLNVSRRILERFWKFLENFGIIRKVLKVLFKKVSDAFFVSVLNIQACENCVNSFLNMFEFFFLLHLGSFSQTCESISLPNQTRNQKCNTNS